MFGIMLGLVILVLIILYYNTKNEKAKRNLALIIKIILSLVIVITSLILWIILNLDNRKLNLVVRILLELIIPLFLFPLWNRNKRKLLFLIIAIYIVISILAYSVNIYFIKKDQGLKIKTDININVDEYMPFDEKSKIAILDNSASLKLSTNLPTLDGAAAVFPLYSSFINAVYPNTVTYGKNPFVYNNTKKGYAELAEKKTDIFFGAFPSQEQISYAKMKKTEFEYTEIGKEGFIFFVNKDNPITSLTSEQIKGIKK